jgi:hypothetical protein
MGIGPFKFVDFASTPSTHNYYNFWEDVILFVIQLYLLLSCLTFMLESHR